MSANPHSKRAAITLFLYEKCHFLNRLLSQYTPKHINCNCFIFILGS